MQRRRFLVGLGTAAATGLAGCSMLRANKDSEFDVGMTATSFDPYEFTVSVGDEVVWLNTSSRSHTVTAYENSIPSDATYFASGGYDSESAARNAWRENMGGRLENGDTFRHTFDVPGRYEYFCIPHEQAGMVGRIVVEESTATTATTTRK